MKRVYSVTATILFVAMACSTGCGEDETVFDDTSTTGAGGSGGDGSTGGGGGEDNTTTGPPGSGGMAGVGGSAGAAPSGNAEAFCADYDDICGTGDSDRFGSVAACEAYYEAGSVGCRSCLEQQLELAETMSTNPYCAHACGDDTAGCSMQCADNPEDGCL